MTEGYQGCIFLYSSPPRVAETKCAKGQGEGKWEGDGEKINNIKIKINKIVFKNSIVLLSRQ